MTLKETTEPVTPIAVATPEPRKQPGYVPDVEQPITARVVIKEETKTILRPDWTKTEATYRHMNDGTVDIYSENTHPDGTTSHTERFNVPEAEIQVDAAHEKSQEEQQGSLALEANQTTQGVVVAPSDLQYHEDIEAERKARTRIAGNSVGAVIFLLLALFVSWPLIIPTIIFVVLVIVDSVKMCNNGECGSSQVTPSTTQV